MEELAVEDDWGGSLLCGLGEFLPVLLPSVILEDGLPLEWSDFVTFELEGTLVSVPFVECPCPMPVSELCSYRPSPMFRCVL